MLLFYKTILAWLTVPPPAECWNTEQHWRLSPAVSSVGGHIPERGF